MFSCNLPPAPLAEWPGSFTCYCSNTGRNGYRNKSHRKLTLENKILPPLLQGFEPATFQSRIRRSNHWAIPAPIVICSIIMVCLFFHFFLSFSFPFITACPEQYIQSLLLFCFLEGGCPPLTHASLKLRTMIISKNILPNATHSIVEKLQKQQNRRRTTNNDIVERLKQ